MISRGPTSKQTHILWFCLTALAVAAVLGLLGLTVWGLGLLLKRLSAVLMPVVFALVVAYILDPVVEILIRKNIPRLWAILTVLLLCFLVIAALLGAVVPGIVDESRKLIDDMPHDAKTLSDNVNNFMQHSRLGRIIDAGWHSMPAAGNPPALPSVASVATNTNAVEVTLTVRTGEMTNQPGAGSQTNVAQFSADSNSIKQALASPFNDTVVPGVVKVLTSVVKWLIAQLSNVTTWLEFLLGFVLVPFYLFYFLLEKQNIKRSWTDYLPMKESRAKDETVFVLRAINDCMIVFRGQVLVALCVGVMLGAGYLIVGLNYAVLIGVMAAALEIVPYLGTIVCFILAVVVAALQFGDWLHPLLVVGIAATVKLIEDLVIFPRIMGKRSGLHPLTVILAVMIGANLLGGFVGAVLAIPLTAVLRTLMFRYVWKRRGPHAKPAADPPSA